MSENRADYLTRFKPKANSLAAKPISVYLPKDIDAIMRQKISNRSQWMREAVIEKLRREGLLPKE